MKMNDYQAACERTANHGAERDAAERRFVNFALGLMGEAGEVTDCIKKILFHGHSIEESRERLKKELGDLLWYAATIATTAGLTLEEVAQTNIDKLWARYPEGFDSNRSRNRSEGR
jgi:NTP pyrophosphatase (non-canonical NTP hydrolase)